MLNRKLIKAKRLEKHMSQDELAKALGYSGKSMISRIEKGHCDIALSKVIRISKVLEIEVQDLIKGGYKNV